MTTVEPVNLPGSFVDFGSFIDNYLAAFFPAVINVKEILITFKSALLLLTEVKFPLKACCVGV